MPALRSPEDMLTTELKEIYSAERQLSRIIPRLSKRVSSDSLREKLDERLKQGEELIEELDDALEELEAPKARQKNIAMEGLIEDLTHHLEEIEEETLLDPLLLASVQKIEHYCIAAWGAAAAMGRLLEQEKVVKTMDRVLGEGKKFDDEMTRLATEEINPQMLESAEAEDESEEDEDEDETGKTGGRSGSSRGKASRSAKRR
jgi:ferritin-like metal-binding protein YciE